MNANLEHDPYTELTREIARCWEPAQGHWSRFLLLSAPAADSEQPSVAQIHLGTRQIALNFRQIREKNLIDCVEAILAHEVGHHVRYPGSLAVEARLRLLEKTLLSLKDYSLINLFQDLLINEYLGAALRGQLVRVYQAFRDESDWRQDPAFLLYLAVYEELWRMEPGELMGRAHAEYEQAYPDYRADAQLLAQNLFPLAPNIFTQFIYFVSVLCRYVRPLRGELPVRIDPYECGRGDPSAGDWADALTPSAREIEAIKRALDEGWLAEEQGRRLREGVLESRIWGLPGQGTADAERVPEIMAAYYRQQAERYLLRPPPQRALGEAVVPTSPEEWEVGDPVRDIDWLTTLLQSGPVLGAAQPLKRARIAELEGYDVPLWQPRVELYLDVSGSMPDPRMTRNAMTLAAQILTVGAVRAGGWVRALLYSHAHVAYWEWCRSEVEMSRFLMHYVGGGTTFPFPVLRQSLAECGDRQPIRVIITDPDFDANYRAGGEPDARTFAEAGRRSPYFILLLHRPAPESVARYRAAGAKVVEVQDMEAFPRMAADLAFALFGDRDHGDHRLVL
jgi:hypothetical protein